MRWFKHLTNAKNDPDMRLLLAEFGYEGYGVYWMVLETIAGDMNYKEQKAKTSMAEKQWRNSVKISPKKFKQILNFCSKKFGFIIDFSIKFIKLFQSKGS